MGTRAPDPPEPVAALAAQLADLRGTVLGLQARLEHAGMASGVKLHEQVADLARAVAALADAGPGPAISAPVWHDLDPKQRAAQLADLTGWVTGFLQMNYPHVALRKCWPDHPAAVWELSTLRAEWRRIYERQRPELAGALAWHDRWLPGAESRLDKILRECRGSCCLLTAPVRAVPRSRPRAG